MHLLRRLRRDDLARNLPELRRQPRAAPDPPAADAGQEPSLDPARAEKGRLRGAGLTGPRRHSFQSRPLCREQASSVLRNSMAMVIGPTPPGTGVIAPATFAAASNSTSPISRVLPGSAAGTRLMPTSITVAP